MAVARVIADEARMVERLRQLYQHDLSEFRGTMSAGAATDKTSRPESMSPTTPQ